MCGFLGAISLNRHQYIRDKFRSSLELLKHRGPDNIGMDFYDNVFLGHTRLSILDLSTHANQPYKDDRFSLIYNGEIYNHSELREKFKNINFTTSSDTETLFYGLKEQGISFLNEIEGMFSGAIFDKTENTVTLFRDGLGIKPHYYYIKDDTLIFSSESKAITALVPEKLHYNQKALEYYYLFENYPQDLTFFEEVKMLLPGEVKTFKIETDSLSVTNNKIHSINYSMSLNQYQDTVLDLNSAISSSVKKHMLSDVPIGVYLSGGIDSSLVSSIASQYENNLTGYTGYFDISESFYDERSLAKSTAMSSGIKHREVKITYRDMINHFDELIWHLDDPRMGAGALSQFVVAREASKECKVMLAGHGGDELFAGYPMFKAYDFIDNSTFIKKLSILFKLKKKEVVWLAYFLLNYLLKKKFFFAPQLNKSIKLSSLFPFSKDKSITPLADLFQYYKNVYLPGLLVVEDKISMAHSLETRVPLWSQSLVQKSYSIPIEYKLRNGQLKSILKDVAQNHIPSEVINGPKRGFPTPIRQWFKNDLYEWAYDRLSVDSEFLDSYMSKKKRLKLLSKHKSIPLPHSFDEKRAHKIWILLCLESWHRQNKGFLAN